MDPVTLENALEKKCKNYTWLTWISFLTTSPVIFIGLHLSSYVFLGGNPSFFCNIPELVEANWTKEQIREISNPRLEKQSCVQYAWNYTLLKELGFDEALSYYNLRQKPDVIKCKSYIYDEDTVHKTVVSEWDLVCDDSPLGSTAQGSIAIGKFAGALIFGMISDRYGRKKTFIFSSIMCMVAGPSAALVNSFTMFIVFRLLIGFATSGMFETAFTILTELTVKRYRAYLGNIFNIGFSFGLLYLSVAAYLTHNWRQLQLAISVPMILLVIQCWFLPESPRWLIVKGRLEKVSNVIGKKFPMDSNKSDQPPCSGFEVQADSKNNKVLSFFKDYFKLFSTPELAKRTFISNYLWFMGNSYYYIIALSGMNLDINQYLYIGLNGIVEIPGFLLPLLFLTYCGRKTSGIALWIFSSITMLVIIALPQGWPIMTMTLVGRLFGTAGYGTIMFHTIELFPTENRNTALGSCLTSGQLGLLLAPYIVEILGKKIWWIPTALCGFLGLLGAFLLVFIPETRDKPMLDTISEMKQLEKEVSSQ